MSQCLLFYSKWIELAEDFSQKYKSTWMPMRNRQIIQVALHSKPEFRGDSGFLQTLEDYAERWMKLLSCFEDLRPALESLSCTEHEKFLAWSSMSVKSQRPALDSHTVSLTNKHQMLKLTCTSLSV